ncbi:MAG: RtcB family protein [bacterium]
MEINLKKIDNNRWEIPKTGGMRVPGKIFASEKMIEKIIQDKAVNQVANVAHIPGIVGFSLAMPDIHWGYGMPIGGVAATEISQGGIISPGMVGYDTNCGMRLVATKLDFAALKNQLEALINLLFKAVPSGVGSKGRISFNKKDLKQALCKGAKWAVEKGFGEMEDLDALESGGRFETADPEKLSYKALERGVDQLGSLGSGNHFLEIQILDEVFDEKKSQEFGLFKGQILVMIHTGSRGVGHQMCTDQLKIMEQAHAKYKVQLPDRQLAGVPFDTDEGRNYFAAMSAAANFAWANRQMITHWVREVFMKTLNESPKNLGLEVISDIGHNLARVEEHDVDGKKKKVVVHRKGAALSIPPNHPLNPPKYKGIGLPILIPGSMGTASYILVGTEQAAKETFCSTCHGAGRAMSRSEAVRRVRGNDLANELNSKGILVQTGSLRGLAEEAPIAYKDVSEVVNVCQAAGISKKVAKLKPIAVIKG